MTSNVGNLDRIIRLVLGVILLVLPFVSGAAFFSGTFGTLASVVVGVVLIATALRRFCPLYRILGVNSCKL